MITFWIVGLMLVGFEDNTTDRPAVEFQQMLTNARAHPEQADWHALRLAFARTQDYQWGTPPVDFEPILQEVKNGERAAALVAVDRLMSGRWVNPEAHFYAALACHQLGENNRRDLHLAFGRGLRAAMTQAGDGHSFQTAYQILFRDEEAYLLRWRFDREPTQCDRVKMTHDGRHYEVQSLRQDSGTEVQIYFDVELLWNRENQTTKNAEKPDKP